MNSCHGQNGKPMSTATSDTAMSDLTKRSFHGRKASRATDTAGMKKDRMVEYDGNTGLS